MEFFIKEEPIEYVNEPSQITTGSGDFMKNSNNPDSISSSSSSTSIDKKFESESFFLNKLNENVLTSIDNEDIELFSELMSSNQLKNINELERIRPKEILIEDVLEKIDKDYQPSQKNASRSAVAQHQNVDAAQTKEARDALLKQKQEEKLSFEKKRILMTILESAKENEKNNPQNKYEKLSQKEEDVLLSQLKNVLGNDLSDQENCLEMNDIFRLRRFKAKLEVRSLKRKKHIKLFDIDSYANELIDSEKTTKLNNIKHTRLIKKENDRNFANEQGLNRDNSAGDDNEEDDDIIFENETLKESLDGSNNCEIVAVTRVLDRFNSKTNTSPFYDIYHSQMPIGMVDSRNDDIKCVISPFTGK